MLIWELGFDMQVSFFGPTSNTGIIETSTVNIWSYGQELDAATVQLIMDAGGEGNFELGEIAYIGSNLPDSQITGTVDVWDNVSHRLVLSNVSGFFQANSVVTGASSNAAWEVANSSPDILLASIVVTPTPSGANAQTAYGFDTVITEFPKTV